MVESGLTSLVQSIDTLPPLSAPRLVLSRVFKMVVKMYLHQDPSALNHFTWDLYLRPLTLG